MLTALLLVFLVGLVMSVPIALTMLLATLIPGWISSSFAADTAFIVRGIIGGADSTPIIAVPLFMLSGIVMARGGISEKLFNVFAYLFGKMRAGLPCTVIITCLFYGAISGSGPATCAAVGTMGIPVLLKMGYDRVFCGAIIGTAGGLGVIIPPSIPFILFGIATGASVGNLFLGGILPGILIALCLCGYAIFYCTRHGEDKNAINAYVGGLRARGFGKVFLESFWALLTPVIILGGIYSGAVTPTEAACISVIYSLVVSIFIYRSLKPGEVWREICDSVRSYAPILALIALASAFSRVLTLIGAPAMLAEYLLNNFSTRAAFLIALNLILLILGMLIDVGPAIVIIGPLLSPIAAALNIDIVHLGIIVVVNLAIGFVSPPFGLNLFVASPLANVPVGALGKKCIPFTLCFIAALLLITFIPAISLAL